jgi:hypothetical protein
MLRKRVIGALGALFWMTTELAVELPYGVPVEAIMETVGEGVLSNE